MAIDTAAKRASAIGLGLSFLRLGVLPDGGNLDAPQRLHANWMYSGIAANTPSVAVPIVVRIVGRYQRVIRSLGTHQRTIRIVGEMG